MHTSMRLQSAWTRGQSLGIGLLVCSLAPPVLAQTDVYGPVTGSWTVAGSPYRVTDHLTVYGLTIQPGVEVIVSPTVRILIATTIQAVGTATQPIRFRAEDPSREWFGMQFHGSPPGSRLSYCSFESAGASALDLVDSTPQIDHCVFTSNSTLTQGGAVLAKITSGDLVFDRCTFSYNQGVLRGGAIAAELDQGDLVLRGCVLVGNALFTAGSGEGGGIYAVLADGELRMSQCAISSNRSAADFAYGGGVYVRGDYRFTQCYLRENVAEGGPEGFGGGLFVDRGTGVLENCIFGGNLASSVVRASTVAYGGGLFLRGESLRATSCLFIENRAFADTRAPGATWRDRGGNIFMDSTADLDLANCTVIWGKTHSRVGGGVFGLQGRTVIKNSILWGNHGLEIDGTSQTVVTFTTVQGSPVYPGPGNINTDPQLLHDCGMILPTSPSVDAGDPAFAEEDSAHPPALGGARNDMGAHGGPLAHQWRRDALPLLAVTPSVFNQAGTGTIAIANGDPGSLFVIALVAENQTPLPPPGTALLFDRFCADGSFTLEVAVPVTGLQRTLTLRVYTLSSTGTVLASNDFDVTIG